MEKKSDINDVLSGIGSKAQQAGGAMSSWYQGLNPDMRSAVTRGLIGAGTGAALTGGMAALAGREDPEHQHNIKGQALMGALLGGTAAAGLPLGLKMLSGDSSFSGESNKPLIAHMGDKITGSAVKHPATVGLTGVAAAVPRTRESLNQLYDTLRASRTSGKPLRTRLVDAFELMNTRAHLSETLASPGFDKLKGTRYGTAMKRLASIKKVRPGQHVRPGHLAAIPLAVGGGLMLDKYLRGEY